MWTRRCHAVWVGRLLRIAGSPLEERLRGLSSAGTSFPINGRGSATSGRRPGGGGSGGWTQSSGRQADPAPAPASAGEAHAIVEAMRAARPEFESVRDQPIAAPVRRPAHVAAFESSTHGPKAGEERRAARDRRAL